MDSLAETARLLESLRGIWDEEAVDELDHALQSAAQAIAAGADDELVLASALHDLGHSRLLGLPSDYPHDKAAARWLTPRFGDRVGWLAGAHVAAKRFLAETEPGYAADLSETSTVSLAMQGGAGADAAYVEHPWWPDAVRLRRFDDAAKVPGAQAVSIDDVLTVAARVLRGRATHS
ncbi:HD family phosphohydrolase [Antrihabitans cavernicola]|uniref:HD family phosphohydrolase n=1 Tax=Antrihabitans cavernicola TaxID=2495913 RepID=A0A5A7SG74_9NOCA|nr:HD family phosphohydrolase [Spelaeibacter cavernicola]KAA0023261.1 HD family phosphohydrolase [Spelaeibacter cavernicola]